MQSLKEKAFDNMQWTGIASVYFSAVQFVQLFILAMFLSPAEIGTMTMVLLMIWFAQALADGGMSPAIIHRKKLSQGILNSLFWLNILYSIVLYVILVALKQPLSNFFNQPELVDYIPVAASIIIIAAIGTQFRVLLNKELRFDLVARHEMGSITLNIIVAVTMAWNGYGVWSMVIGYLAGGMLSTIILVFYGLKFWKPGFHLSFTGLYDLIVFGVYQMGERVLIFLNSRVDQLLIGSLLGAQALGIYTLAHNFVIGPTIRVNQIISTVMFPVFAKIQDDDAMLRKGYLKLVKIVTIINTPILLGIAVVAPVLVPILYDQEWHYSIYILQILSVYALIRSTGSPAGSLQLAKGRADLGFKWNFSLMLITAPVIYAGFIAGGLSGIALAQVALAVSLFVPYWIFMIKPLIGPPAKSYYFAIFDALVPGVFMGAVVWVVWLLTQGLSDLLQLGIMILAGAFSFVYFAYRNEQELFKEVSELAKNKYSRNA
jgi:O-antigen/teichoic acid export membrane protein